MEWDYDAYCRASGGVSLISGDKLPDFDALKIEIVLFLG